MYNKMTKLFLRVKTIASENSKKYCHRGVLLIFLHQRLIIGLECLVIFCIEGFFFTRQLFFTRQSLFCGPVFSVIILTPIHQ